MDRRPDRGGDPDHQELRTESYDFGSFTESLTLNSASAHSMASQDSLIDPDLFRLAFSVSATHAGERAYAGSGSLAKYTTSQALPIKLDAAASTSSYTASVWDPAHSKFAVNVSVMPGKPAHILTVNLPVGEYWLSVTAARSATSTGTQAITGELTMVPAPALIGAGIPAGLIGLRRTRR